MRKNLHGRIIKEQPKEQHLNTVSKLYVCIYGDKEFNSNR